MTARSAVPPFASTTPAARSARRLLSDFDPSDAPRTRKRTSRGDIGLHGCDSSGTRERRQQQQDQNLETQRSQRSQRRACPSGSPLRPSATSAFQALDLPISPVLLTFRSPALSAPVHRVVDPRGGDPGRRGPPSAAPPTAPSPRAPS